MHPFDVLYRGVNLTEPSHDDRGLVRTWVAWLAVSLAVAAALSARFPHWSESTATIVALASIGATLPATFATFSAAQARACRILPTDVVEYTLLDTDTTVNHERGLHIAAEKLVVTVFRDGQLWRRRTPHLDEPYELSMPLHTPEEVDKVLTWWTAANLDEVSATARFRPKREGRIDMLPRLDPYLDPESLVVEDLGSYLRVTFRPSR